MYRLQIHLLRYLTDGVHINKYRIKEQMIVLLQIPFYIESWWFNKVVKNKHLNALRAHVDNDLLYQLLLKDYQKHHR